MDTHLFILYQDRSLLHCQTLEEYMTEFDEDLETIIERAGSKQVIVLTENTEIKPLQNEEDIKEFYQKSKKFKDSINSITHLAKGGEATVYRLDHKGLEELVIKCCLFDQKTSPDIIDKAYDSIFHETSLLKLNPSNGLVEIMEEIIELNIEKGLIISYSVVIE